MTMARIIQAMQRAKGIYKGWQ